MRADLGEWEWRTAVSLPPPNGKVGSDTGDWGLGVSQIYFSVVDVNGVNRLDMMQSVQVGEYFRIWKSVDSSVWSFWEVQGAGVDHAGYWSFPVVAAEVVGAPNVATFTCFLSPDISPVPEPPDPPDGFRWVERYIGQVSGGAVANEAWALCTDHSLLHWVGGVWEEVDDVPPSLEKEPPPDPVVPPVGEPMSGAQRRASLAGGKNLLAVGVSEKRVLPPNLHVPAGTVIRRPRPEKLL